MNRNLCLCCLASAILLHSRLHAESPDNATQLSGVAVIDLEELASRLGRIESFQKEVEARKKEISSNLTTLQTAYRHELEQARAKYGATLSDEQQVELQALELQMQGNIQQYGLQSQAELSRMRTVLVDQFRDEVKPTVQRVARQRGFLVVLSKNDDIVFTFDERANITEDVAQHMLSKQAESNQAEAQDTLLRTSN